ncbi:Alpha/Beta hydrolase protein [Mycena floridula]|nr:Alpha/Beta hydrolase protein [Mycena floridula]
MGFRMSDQPVLRWLGSWSSPPSPRRIQSSIHGSPTGSLASLDEALHEPLRFPPPARLPELYNSRSLRRPPPFLDNLTRSTLPLSSVSRPYNHYETTPIVSPPTGSSLDSLRSFSTTSRNSSPSVSEIPTSAWRWFQSENKENVDAMLDEEDRAETVQEERDRINKKYLSTKNPVVFCHGLLGFDSVTIAPSIQISHWRGIREILQANGTEVLITRVPATSSPVERAKVLEEKISEVYPGRSVHLIGHSMGGLDCRYLTTHLTGRKFKVVSVSTIATPHRGSSFASHFLETLGKARLPQFLSLLDLLPNGGGDGTAFEFLTVESMAKFNETTPDVKDVQYFSWGATYDPGFVDTWKWSHGVILEKEGPNDGLVSIESAKWGKYMGTLEDCNHLDLVGWVNEVRYKWHEMIGKKIKFRPATFYLSVVDILAREVDGVEPEDAPSPPVPWDSPKRTDLGLDETDAETSDPPKRKSLDERLTAAASRRTP